MSDRTVTLRLQTPRMLDKIDGQVKEFNKKVGDKVAVESPDGSFDIEIINVA